MSGPAIVRTTSHIREIVEGWRAAYQTVALVPTMGNLHRGHLSLARLAAERADKTIMSIFVNPTQFGANEDFDGYPRTLDQDRALLEEAGLVDALFVPETAEVYPFGPEHAVRVALPELAHELCGAARPGHFDGVATVVLRLLTIVGPDILVLGQKDYQQLVLIGRMIADLRLPIELVSGETQRDEDGLAISSRNSYLTPEERSYAPLLHATLENVRKALELGSLDYGAIEDRAIEELRQAGFKPDYVEVRRARDLGKPNGERGAGELIVLAAAWLGKARLIDNVRV